MPKLLGDRVIPQILDAGFNLDFIDGDAIDSLGIHYPVLVLPGIERLPLGTYQKIEQYALHGGIVIATRRLPSTAPGLMNAESESRQIQRTSPNACSVTRARRVTLWKMKTSLQVLPQAITNPTSLFHQRLRKSGLFTAN